MARTGGHGFLTSREVTYWKGFQYIQAMSQLLCVQLESRLPLQDSCSLRSDQDTLPKHSSNPFYCSFSEYSGMEPELNLLPECTPLTWKG